ncbi:PrsW family glutamic-type intramembrane protease [Prosthecobacter sp.]|uniref:PrsW family glutamic-type intramembrane protease n=1 Tax=Prosthecobacter sp. TaxID=1965333 RepID=UPI0037830CA0
MSEKPSLFHGLRARTHYLTRNRRFLLRTAASIIAIGTIIASAIVIGSPHEDGPAHPVFVSAALNKVREDCQHLERETSPHPRELARWLRMLVAQIPQLMKDNDAAAYQSFVEKGKIGGYDVEHLLQQHATSDAPAGLFRDYLAATLDADAAAFRQLQQKAAAMPPEMLAGELFGSVEKRRDDIPAAIQAFYTEGLHFPDAASAREEALRLAVTQRDLPMLRTMAAQPGWIEQAHPLLQHHAGSLLGDVWMQWHGLIRHRLDELPYGILTLAVFAAGLWYFILVQHSDHERWRWVRPVAALTAGIASVWPTLTILAFQEYHQGMTSEAPFPYDVLYWVGGVGLREEGCKLALFCLFLPWLLWRRTPGLALLTGAFVGLGFALEENIGYYQEHLGAIAWTRFVSANFLHISLTGICAHSLYRMLLTRFARAEEFLTTFGMAVVAHGAYDYFCEDKFEDHGWFSTIILVLCAARFIDLLSQETRPARLTISPRAVFIFGSAALIAVSIVIGAWTTRTMAGVAEAGKDCLSMVPIAMLYWRKFENA